MPTVHATVVQFRILPASAVDTLTSGSMSRKLSTGNHCLSDSVVAENCSEYGQQT